MFHLFVCVADTGRFLQVAYRGTEVILLTLVYLFKDFCQFKMTFSSYLNEVLD